jgi:diadenosine tetraphosphate (Ap4A) HIT family hydrolase
VVQSSTHVVAPSTAGQFVIRAATRPCRFCELRDREPALIDYPGGVVVPSLGALVEGWLLVVPPQHVCALAELSESQWYAFQRVLDQATEAVERHYGPAVRFEHGSAGSGRAAGCGVDHAHMHVVPAAIDLRAAVSKIAGSLGEFVWKPAQSRPDSDGVTDYIWISDATGNWISHQCQIPSQVIRRAIANELGESTWDWKKDHRVHLVQRTRRTLA